MFSEYIKEQCMNYLWEKYSISLNSIHYLLETERDHKYIYQADDLIVDYLQGKEKKDYLFLQRLLNESERTLSVYSNGLEYRVNDMNWEYNPLNNNNEDFSFLSNFYNTYSNKINNYLSKAEIYLNYQFEENFINLTIDSNNRSSINNDLFNNKVLEIRIAAPKKHYSRNHIININKESGSICLRFLSRNQDQKCFFNENININDIYIKELMSPLNIICQEIGSSKHTIIEVIIPFVINNGIAYFNEPTLGIASNHLPIVTIPTNAKFSIETVYNSIEFRKLFSAFEKDSITYPKNNIELYTIIENYKLLKY